MSSRISHRQYLKPADMRMIERALARMRVLYKLDRRSEEEAQVAAVLVGEFQRGNTIEDGLVAVFLGMSDLSKHATRKMKTRKSLTATKNEGGALKSVMHETTSAFGPMAVIIVRASGADVFTEVLRQRPCFDGGGFHRVEVGFPSAAGCCR